MSKSQSTNGRNESLLNTAGAVIARANAIRTVPAMEMAVALGRMVLEGAPHFGASELKDPEILKLLKAEGIGLATFKKALSKVRKELVKKPRSSAVRTARKSKASPATSPATKPFAPRAPRETEDALVENVPTKLL